MKLYATVSSERASKGQGGNTFLNVVFAFGSAKDSHEIAKIMLDEHGFIYIRDKDNREMACYSVQKDYSLTDVTGITTKGERQKGEHSRTKCPGTHCNGPHLD